MLAIVMDSNTNWAALPIGRQCMKYWQNAIVVCGRPGMASSVTEAPCHDKSKGGRSVTGAYMSLTEGGMEMQRVGGERDKGTHRERQRETERERQR